MRKILLIGRMPNRNRTNGPVSRLFSPVNEGLGVVANVGSNVLRTGDNLLGSLGRGSRKALSHITSGVNSAARRLVTGHRGGRRNSTMRKDRKDRKNRSASRKNRSTSRKDRKNRSASRKDRKNRSASRKDRKNRH